MGCSLLPGKSGVSVIQCCWEEWSAGFYPVSVLPAFPGAESNRGMQTRDLQFNNVLLYNLCYELIYFVSSYFVEHRT